MQTRPWTPGPVLSALQDQLDRIREWGAEDISLNHRLKFRRRRKKSSSRRSSQGWSPAQLVPGLREGGNDAAWAPWRSQEHHSPGICLQRQPGLQRLREGQLSQPPRLTPRGSVRGAQRVLKIPSTSAPEKTPPTFAHRSIQAWQRQRLGGQQKPPQQGRGQPGAGKSPKAHERGRPRAGVQAQLPAEAKV